MNKTEYLLTVLMEECAEVAQRASKAIRFTLEEIQPGMHEGYQDTNKRRLERELGDLLAVMQELGLTIHEEDVLLKLKKLDKYMDYSRKLGTLEAS